MGMEEGIPIFISQKRRFERKSICLQMSFLVSDPISDGGKKKKKKRTKIAEPIVG